MRFVQPTTARAHLLPLTNAHVCAGNVGDREGVERPPTRGGRWEERPTARLWFQDCQSMGTPMVADVRREADHPSTLRPILPCCQPATLLPGPRYCLAIGSVRACSCQSQCLGESGSRPRGTAGRGRCARRQCYLRLVRERVAGRRSGAASAAF